MEQSSSADHLRGLLRDLYVQPGLSGACLQLGGMVLAHDLPYSDDRVTQLAARIDHLVTSYESVGRGIWQICVGFETLRLLILCHSEMRLGMFLQPHIDPGLAATRGMHLLMQVKNLAPPQAPTFPTPATATPTPGSDIARAEFEKILSGLLGRVTGSIQAGKLIQRQFAAYKINGSTMIELGEARRIGVSILEQIPNRGKRAALTSEFLNTLIS